MNDEPTRLNVVLWDIDGTLVDTTALIVSALQETFVEFTGTSLPTEELRAMIGIPLERQMLAMGEPATFGATVPEMCAAVVRRYERGRAQERIIPEAIEALIEGKRQGIPTGLVTSKSDYELTHSLPRLGISAYCDVIISADDVSPRVKPDPYPVLLALERLGITSLAGVIFVGDSTHDIKCGNAAGVETAGVLWGAATEATLVAENPGRIIRRPEDLIPSLFGKAMAAAA